MRKLILNKDNEVLGFNIGMNAGKIAGQTIMHCHKTLRKLEKIIVPLLKKLKKLKKLKEMMN